MTGALLFLGFVLTACLEAPTGDDDNPELSFSPTVLDFGTDKQSLNLRIENVGTGSLHWELGIPSADAEWIESEQRVGDITTQASSFSITIKRDVAPVGEQTVFLDIVTPVGTGICTLLAVIERAAVLAVSPTSLDFNTTSTTQQIEIRNSGGADLSWQASSGQSWVAMSPESGTVAPGEAQTMLVTITRDRLAPGDLNGSISITSNGGGRSVVLRGSVADAGRLAVSSSSIEFGESLTSQQLTITNTGGASLSWSASSASSWISLSPMSGTVAPDAEQFVTVTVSREGQETDFLGSIEIDSDGGAASVSVSALLPAAPLLSVSPTALTFGAATNRQELTLQNTGSIALDWTVTSGDSWLVPLTLAGAVLPGESRTIFVAVRRDELTVGTHQSALTFSGSASDVSVTATVTVQAAPDLGLTGSIEVGEDPGFVLQIANLGTGTLNWVARETSDWLVIDVTEGSAGALGSTVTATIDREGLAADDYSTTVFITSDGGNGEVQVSMTVPLPVVRFLSGPGPEETALEDSATWELAADKIFGEVEYSTRMDGGSWSDWSADPVFGYGGLEESSLFGSHEIEGRVRTAAGQSNPQMRSFEVDALQGPAIRITPMRMQTSPGEDMTVSVVLEEVIGVLGGRVVVTFDEAIEVSDASLVEDLLDGATAISPSITVERGRVELGFAAAGLAGGISGTGAILRLTLSANSSSAIEIGSESTLRDLSNQDIPIRVRDGQILVE